MHTVYRRRVVLTLGRNGGNQRPVTDRSRQVFLACLAVAHILWLIGLKAPTNWLANCQWYVWRAGHPSWGLEAGNARRATNTQPVYTRQHDKDKPAYRCEVCGQWTGTTTLGSWTNGPTRNAFTFKAALHRHARKCHSLGSGTPWHIDAMPAVYNWMTVSNLTPPPPPPAPPPRLQHTHTHTHTHTQTHTATPSKQSFCLRFIIGGGGGGGGGIRIFICWKQYRLTTNPFFNWQ